MEKLLQLHERSPAVRRAATNPWVVLVLICLAQFMVVLDATIVNVCLLYTSDAADE